MATFFNYINDTEWNAIATGANVKEIGLQVCTSDVFVNVTEGQPAASDQDFIVLSRNGDRSVTLTLGENDTVWVKAPTSDGVAVRGYSVQR